MLYIYIYIYMLIFFIVNQSKTGHTKEAREEASIQYFKTAQVLVIF